MKKVIYKTRENFKISTTIGIIKLEFAALRQNKNIFASLALQPILYFLFYAVGISQNMLSITYSGMEVSYLLYLYIGIIGILINSQLRQSVYRVVLDKKWGLLALKFYQGASSTSYLLGKFFFPLILFIFQLVLLYVIAMPFNIISLSTYVLIALVSLCSIFFWYCLGVIISLKITSYKMRDFVLDFVMFPIIFSAPTFYSLDRSVGYIKVISGFNPLTYQLNAMRDIVFGNGSLNNVVVMIILTIIIFLVTLVILKSIDFQTEEH